MILPYERRCLYDALPHPKRSEWIGSLPICMKGRLSVRRNPTRRELRQLLTACRRLVGAAHPATPAVGQGRRRRWQEEHDHAPGRPGTPAEGVLRRLIRQRTLEERRVAEVITIAGRPATTNAIALRITKTASPVRRVRRRGPPAPLHLASATAHPAWIRPCPAAPTPPSRGLLGPLDQRPIREGDRAAGLPLASRTLLYTPEVHVTGRRMHLQIALHTSALGADIDRYSTRLATDHGPAGAGGSVRESPLSSTGLCGRHASVMRSSPMTTTFP
jgi:hypothetical protein